MIYLRRALSLIGVLAATSVASASPATATSREAFTNVDGTWVRSEHGCGTRQLPPVADPWGRSPLPAPGLRTIYLNKNGATYRMVNGATDASTNSVQAGLGPVSGSFTIPPLNTNTFDWLKISACVREHFKKYNAVIVETEPTSGTYIEAVVGGTGQELGFGQNELFGIASADNFCNVTEKGIAFNFSETHRGVPRRDDELCATIAHEIGHLIALEHEQLRTDLMSYVLIADSQTKAFVDQNSGCGTSPQDPGPCYCGGGGQTNSHARLVNAIGLRPIEVVPPTLEIDAPGGQRVPPSFEIVATATDNEMMFGVVALIDEVEIGNDLMADANVYRIMARGVAEGPHTLAVIATDAAGNTTRKELSITVQKAATGETCIENEACAGNLCAQTADGNFCTQVCEPSNDTCPEDFACATIGDGSSVCVAAPGGGCGCSSSNAPGAMFLLIFGTGAILLRRRRR